MNKSPIWNIFYLTCYVLTIGLVSITVGRLWPTVNNLQIGLGVMYFLAMVTLFRGIMREANEIMAKIVARAEQENATRFIGEGTVQSIKRGE